MFRSLSVRRSFLLFIFASFACLNGNECTAAQPTKVAVGYATISVSSLALWLAQDEKLFAKNDIDADLVFMPGSPTLIAAINSGAIAAGFTGGTAILAAAAGGADFKVLAASHVRANHDLIVKPEIKRAEDLRGKRIGVTSIGGTGWMAAMLVFEQLGLNQDKDKLIVSAFGEMRIISRALETGTIDAALVTGNFTSQFRRAGYNILGELERVPMMGNAVVVKQSFLHSQTDFLRNFLRAISEAQVFVLSPMKKQSVLRVLSRRLSITDPAVAEDALQDLIKRLDKKPIPSVQALRNIQRFLQTRNPKVGQVKLEELIDEVITHSSMRVAMSWIWGFIVSACFLLSCSASSYAASASPKLIIGYAAMSARVVPLWIAEEQGILSKYGIDSEQVFIRGAPTLVSGLASGDIHVASTGGTAMLAAIAAGHDLKILAAFSTRNTYDLVARPNIKRAEDLRGKRFGVTSIGGTVWMGALLWLEHFGLDVQRDQIQFQVIGDQTIQMQAMETGIIDAAVLDGVFSRRLKQKGFSIIGEYSDLKQLYISQALVVQQKFLQQRPDTVENLLKAEIEAIAFSLAPKNKPTIIKTFMRRLKIDATSAEEGYADLQRAIDRKPDPSPEGLRTVQRLMKIRSPKVGEIKVEDVVDNRIMRKLDESGFIDRAYAAQGMSLK